MNMIERYPPSISHSDHQGGPKVSNMIFAPRIAINPSWSHVAGDK